VLGSSLVNRRHLYDIMRAPDGRCTSRAVCPIPLAPEPVVAQQITITTEGLQPRHLKPLVGRLNAQRCEGYFFFF